MKKARLLFNKLKEIAVLENVGNAFDASGMENIFDYLDYGFFPLGNGILSSEHKSNTDIQENQVMVLGNDFGTKEYLIKQCPDRSEKQSNPTIKNLTTLLNLDLKNTFFTNINLGVRYEGTNTKRAKDLTEEYQKICFDFFVNQLNIINPKTIICLGHDVRKNLCLNSNLFDKWNKKSISIKQLYKSESKDFQLQIDDNLLGKRTFILVPHPCDLRNFNSFFVDIINNELDKTSVN